MGHLKILLLLSFVSVVPAFSAVPGYSRNTKKIYRFCIGKIHSAFPKPVYFRTITTQLRYRTLLWYYFWMIRLVSQVPFPQIQERWNEDHEDSGKRLARARPSSMVGCQAFDAGT